jgi:hypothetical protein
VVVWTNVGGSAHTVTADDGSFDTTANGSASMPAGSTFSYTFSVPGLNPYYCRLHGSPGGLDMAGVIRVIDASTNNPPATPANTAPAVGANNLSLSPTLTASAFVDGDGGDIHQASQWLVRNVITGEIELDTGESSTNLTSLSLADLSYSSTYAWKVRYKDDRDAWSQYSTETQFTTVAAPTSPSGGLTATYGAYIFKTNTVTVRATELNPGVNFDWGLGKPHRSTAANNFFVRWEGKLLPEFSERHRFHVRADGGVRLWVNGVLIIDDWVSTPFPIFRNNVAMLEAGVAVSIKLEYFDTLGKALVSLGWSSRNVAPAIIPAANLFPVAP